MPTEGILDDDAPSGYQRATLAIFGSTFVLGTIAYLTWTLVGGLRMGILRKRKLSFLWFFGCIELSFVFRFFYCFSGRLIPFNRVFYGLWCFFPPVLTTTASLFFILSMLNSLDEVSRANTSKRYNKLRLSVLLSALVFWLLCIEFYLGLVYQDHKTEQHGDYQSFPWTKAFFFTSAGCNIVVCGILIFVTIIYTQELRKFICTYQQKRLALFIMLSVTIMQLLGRTIQAVLNGSGVLISWQDSVIHNDNISFHVYTCGYYILSDVLPALGYNFYLNKEIQAQASLDATSKESGAHNPSTNVAELLEKLYKSQETKRNSTRFTSD